MSAEISNVEVHEHPSSGDKLIRTGGGEGVVKKETYMKQLSF
jgi:hypothetical protein